MNIHRFASLSLAAGWLLALALTTPAGAVCLANCRDHCIGTCKCIARTTPDCNCNVFSCNCDCCKRMFNTGCGGCQCQNSLTVAGRARKPASPMIAVCNCGSGCCRAGDPGCVVPKTARSATPVPRLAAAAGDVVAEAAPTASPPAPAETTEPALGPAERFAAVDTDHSGGISLDEMIKWVAENHPDGSAMMRLFTRAEFAKRYFAPLDRNHNGVIDPEEFDAELAPAPKKAPH